MGIGAAAGFVASTVYQLITKRKVNWKDAGKSALIGGGISLFLASLPVTSAIAASLGGGTALEVGLEFAYSFGLGLLTEISEHEKPEADKVVTEEDLNCGFTVSCQTQVIEGQEQILGQPPGTPSTPSTSSQANSAINVNTGSSGNRISQRSLSAGTSVFGRGTPQQIIRAAGGSTLKNPAQKTASEALAKEIIKKQREAAKKATKPGG